MPGFGRGARERAPRKATQMTYTGGNGPEIVDWARDADLSPRFATPTQPGAPGRLLQPASDGQGTEWVPVPKGATIHRNPDTGELYLELPDDGEETQA